MLKAGRRKFSALLTKRLYPSVWGEVFWKFEAPSLSFQPADGQGAVAGRAVPHATQFLAGQGIMDIHIYEKFIERQSRMSDAKLFGGWAANLGGNITRQRSVAYHLNVK